MNLSSRVIRADRLSGAFLPKSHQGRLAPVPGSGTAPDSFDTDVLLTRQLQGMGVSQVTEEFYVLRELFGSIGTLNTPASFHQALAMPKPPDLHESRETRGKRFLRDIRARQA